MTDKQIKETLSNITILIDTREKQIQHITNYFDEKGIRYERQKLEFGDYSFRLNNRLFKDEICIERKNSLEELSSNFATYRSRFEREFDRSNGKVVLLVENASLDNILEGKYQTDLKPSSYWASLITFQHRYNISINFVHRIYSGHFIYSQFYYFLRNQIKGGAVK